MIADPGTRCGELYALAVEVLPEDASDRGAAADLESDGVAVEGSCADPFVNSREQLETMLGWLSDGETDGLEHSQLEERLQADGRELLRRMLDDKLELRALREQRLEGVACSAGVVRAAVERGHERLLSSVFGQVTVGRQAYRRRGCQNLYLADAQLNLPRERPSHGTRRLAAVGSSKGSFEEATEQVREITGLEISKRQVEELARAAAVDFDAFYASQASAAAEQDNDSDDDVLVISCDGKGIVIRSDGLRPATAAAAQRAQPKLRTRLSRGEKPNRKRIAEVGAVYEVKPRTGEEVLASSAEKTVPAPEAKRKWLTASVVCDAATVVGQVFDEAQRRDPQHQRTWVVLVDGNNHQIDRITAEANARAIKLTIVIDLVHVLEYLWGACWSFFNEGDPAAERWVHEKALAVLEGKASIVAASIRRKATRLGLDTDKRAKADRCADYLHNKAPYLDYPTALRNGWPIATGVIEGACRHLVKDRMDRTGARWGLQGAEAVLKLRALRSNGDFDSYWRFHLAQEQRRVHKTRYANGVIPQAQGRPSR
ncbi:MAG TPA: ISKra4 family transposase [Solirubrobacteraceae bacterium]|nr:ISKra4 family transposase [Solirubrobacteraceae bacterium]